MDLRTADLFAGIGGIRLGVEQACKDKGFSHSCVFASEINPSSITVYRKKFGGPDPAVDITSLEGREAEAIPDHDMLLAGFPCQAFSHAGNRKGFLDQTRGTLFYNTASVIRAKRPPFFLLENVYGLVTHNKGKTFKTVMAVLQDELGYHVQAKVLNSRYFGVPHNRPRVYIVGFADPRIYRNFRFPTPPDSPQVALGDILEDGRVPSRYYLSEQYMDTLRRHKAKHAEKKHGFGYQVRSRTDVAACLVLGGMGHERNLIQDKKSITSQVSVGKRVTMTNSEFLRRLSPIETERLQGFPDGFTEDVSETARWDLLANSVTVPVIRAIAANILEAIASPVDSEDPYSPLSHDLDATDDSPGCQGGHDQEQEDKA